jgi:mediator of RNA polymerase II transcription subunit 9
MVFRYLLNYFSNHPQLIERLSESYPMRRAAQLTVYVFHRSKSILEDKAVQQKAIQFKDTFSNELKKEWKKARGRN